MNIEEINRKHFIETDMYYRVGFGLTSKLIKVVNGVFTIEVVTSRKWDKDYNATAQELAYLWKKTHKELSHALAARVYIVDAKKYNYKQSLIHRGIKPGYDSKKGVIFRKKYLN